MKGRITIPINEVKVVNRIRQEMGDLESLKNSILNLGLLQPIVLMEDKTLIAGERRLRAHELAGLESIDVVYFKDLSEDERHELELEENIRRKEMSWQEEALGFLRIWRIRKRRGALEGWTWGMSQAAEMFSMSVGKVDYILKVAIRLESEQQLPEPKRRFWQFTSSNEAYRLGLLGEEEDEANAKLAAITKTQINTPQQEQHARELIKQVETAQQQPEVLAFERERYQANPLNTTPFDEYWAEKTKQAGEIKNTIHLSNRVLHCDCIDYMMLEENRGRFDHIITDPPYAIDMDNLNQQNTHGGLTDIDRVIDAHQVEENLSLLAKFFPAAFQCTNDNAFVITCCDPMVWQYMYDLAIKAGFAVQRWPIIWQKVNQNVMNNCANYNSTKDFEIVMVCRKEKSVLAQKKPTSFVAASNNEVKKLFGHPFSKPFELTQFLVELASMEGQTILEPFAGGGSMVAKFAMMKRNWVAVEKETHHYNALLENIKREVFLKLNPNYVFK